MDVRAGTAECRRTAARAILLASSTARPTRRPRDLEIALRTTRQPSFWSRTQWADEDPIRSVARALAVPIGLVVIVIGSVTGNLLVIGSGITLIRVVAMAAPTRS